VLTGLSSGTSYTVSVVASCAAGANSIPVTTTFTTLTPPPAYAALPYAQGFEGPWVNGSSTRDLPDASWRNTPATGDNSWRREDDGASASWQYLSYETPSTGNPVPPYVTRFSQGAHSARFHTFGSAAGAQGKLDLYVNLSSSTASKILTFDYINPTGTDNLAVLLSTDGGATFGAPLLTATTNAAFAAKSVVIASNAATAVIRFQATSDFGNDDLGIDNLLLRVVSATRNGALAATVGLYPNPARQRFTLAVPAGPLHAATATLVNALGQTVLTRPLALPAAGGTADFDVSALAPGVYSLALQAGDTRVVKRLVVE
uniref:T9SS type A sorting domain-containing protein n=1 Tax=Hymenobacter rubidus TaxID=1441626 RepID=UPI00191ED429